MSERNKRQLYYERLARRTVEDAAEAMAFVVYHYPQYRIEDVLEMSEGDVNQLVRFAMRQRLEDAKLQASVTAASANKKSYQRLMSRLDKNIKELKR